ncbi:HpcH/HpaI aldolase family protein [Gulosibacter chungangensis]|uniref:HpcH/HpaI aldolase/citrate lyase domain-containing protein n=1 Tax=Gulosibacter chungangensis TaxID=979746 RepID=A0A7J5B9K9_9MICO|nr:aldolase/citrate lyase family protein [Gulosibacter chungangensis]KAB1642311.1 hypothetical protein F8O05_10860 [Gulosibacter chungangensis]
MSERGPFQRELNARPYFGVFVNTGSAVNAEVCILAGASWVMIDLEHGSGSEAGLLPTLWAVRAAGGQSLVRVESADPARIARALDFGADAIMLPSVNSVTEAEAIVQAAFWPPVGRRGVSLQSRAGGYGNLRHADVADLADAPYIVVQIETEAGLEHVHDIAKVPGVGALFLGPTDLTHDLRIPGQQDHPRFRSAVAEVAAAAAEAGIDAAVLASDRESAEAFADSGYTLIAIGSDAGHLRRGLAACIPTNKETR